MLCLDISVTLVNAFSIFIGNGDVIYISRHINHCIHLCGVCTGSAPCPHSVHTVPIVTYIFNHCIHLCGVCTGYAQGPHPVCTVSALCPLLHIYSITVSICMGSTQGPHPVHTVPMLHIYSITVSICMGSTQGLHSVHTVPIVIYIQSLYPFIWGLHRVHTWSTQCLHCVCNADGTALPQFELCLTLTALLSLFKDNCRPNMDLRDWLLDWCQSKQTHKLLAS